MKSDIAAALHQQTAETVDFVSLVATLLDTYRPGGVVIWLNSPNRRLDGRRPLDLIDAGEWKPLHDEAERLAGAPTVCRSV